MAHQLMRLSLALQFMSSVRLVKRFTFKIIEKFPLLYLEFGLPFDYGLIKRLMKLIKDFITQGVIITS
jgi:hypothetical protein